MRHTWCRNAYSVHRKGFRKGYTRLRKSIYARKREEKKKEKKKTFSVGYTCSRIRKRIQYENFRKRNTRFRASEKVHDKKLPSMGYTCFRIYERVHHQKKKKSLEGIIPVLEMRNGSTTKAAAFGTQTLLLEKGTFTDEEEDMDRWIELSSRDRGQHCRFLFFCLRRPLC